MTVPEGLEPSAIQMPVHQRPQLVPGVSLSPIILSCSLSSDPKAMLAESWTAKTADEAQADCATASPVFNPAAPEYNELAQRVSQSSAMQRWNEAMVRVKHAEKQLKAGGLKGAEKEARQGELDEAQQQLGEAQAALNDVTSSFEADPLSLVPWMSALFALADAGCSCFDAGGGGWPPPNAGQVPLTELLGPPSSSTRGPAAASAWLYGGSEKVLGVFKRRYESERGPGRLSIFTRLAINCFGSDSPADLAAAVEKAVERSRAAIFGPEAAVAGAPLDLVQLHWLDYHEHDFIPVLLKLHCLANDRYEPSPDGTGEMVVTQPRGVAALGLVEPPAHAVTTALRAGVHLACVTVSYSLLNVSAAPVIQLCHSRGIKVFAVGALAYGLMSEAFLGAPAPNPAAAAAGGVAGPTTDSPAGGAAAVGPCEALGPDNLAAGLDMVARYGGWTRFQQLLICLKQIADKHSVSMETVALRWLIDHGVYPVIAARWNGSGRPWATFGHPQCLSEQQFHQPAETAAAKFMAANCDAKSVSSGTDAGLFAADSFLDNDDGAALGSLVGLVQPGVF